MNVAKLNPKIASLYVKIEVTPVTFRNASIAQVGGKMYEIQLNQLGKTEMGNTKPQSKKIGYSITFMIVFEYLVSVKSKASKKANTQIAKMTINNVTIKRAIDKLGNWIPNKSFKYRNAITMEIMPHMVLPNILPIKMMAKDVGEVKIDSNVP